MPNLAEQIIAITVVAFPAGWLLLSVFENVRFPDVNREDVAGMMSLEQIARDWPEIHRRIGGRAVRARWVVEFVFHLIVLAQLVVCLSLWAALACLSFGPSFGVAYPAAIDLALLALLGFSAIWAGFLIGGQWFFYWYGAYGQQTHFFMLLWGLATIAVLLLLRGSAA